MDPLSRMILNNPTGITVRKAEDVRRAETLAKHGWLCYQCKHYQEDLKCAAFPKGIPLEIVGGDILHLKVVGIEDEPVAFEEAQKPSMTDL